MSPRRVTVTPGSVSDPPDPPPATAPTAPGGRAPAQTKEALMHSNGNSFGSKDTEREMPLYRRLLSPVPR